KRPRAGGQSGSAKSDMARSRPPAPSPKAHPMHRSSPPNARPPEHRLIGDHDCARSEHLAHPTRRGFGRGIGEAPVLGDGAGICTWVFPPRTCRICSEKIGAVSVLIGVCLKGSADLVAPLGERLLLAEVLLGGEEGDG